MIVKSQSAKHMMQKKTTTTTINVYETVRRHFQTENKQEFMAALPAGQLVCSGTRLTIIFMGARHCLSGVLSTSKSASLKTR